MNIKKKLLSAGAGLLALGIVASSWAYYSSTNSVDNQMETKEYGNTVIEKFTPDKDWQPGEAATKEVGVKNTGDYSLVVRIKMDERWWDDKNSNGSYDAGEERIAFSSNQAAFLSVTSALVSKQFDFNGTGSGPVDGIIKNASNSDESVVYKALSTSSDWSYNAADGYWYYTKVLAAGASTGNLLTSITLAKDADMGNYITTKYWTESASVAATDPTTANIGSTPTSRWVVYTGAVPSPTVSTNSVYTRSISVLDSAAKGYADAIYDLIITSETCQAFSDAVDATWSGVPASIKTGWAL